MAESALRADSTPCPTLCRRCSSGKILRCARWSCCIFARQETRVQLSCQLLQKSNFPAYLLKIGQKFGFWQKFLQLVNNLARLNCRKKNCSQSWEQIRFLKSGQMVSQLEVGELTWYSLHRWSQWPQLASVAPFRCAPHLCHAVGGASMIFQAVSACAS